MSVNDDHAHESMIKTPKQLIAVVLLGFTVPIVIAALLAHLASSGRIYDKSSAAMSAENVAKRIQPVAAVSTAFGPGSQTTRTGEEIYKGICMACHATGIAQAPKFGDRRDWAKRIAKGQKALMRDAAKGQGAMPPRGGAADLSDLELERAIIYMANAAGARFKETSGAPDARATPAKAASASAGVASAAPRVAKATAAKADGKKIYDSTCVACHGTGVANAPKFGDKAAWASRLAQGMPALYGTALKGKGPMPPKGGNLSLADGDVRAAVDYMVSAAK